MKQKKRLIIYALTTSILLSGCSLSKEEPVYEEALVKPVILFEEIALVESDPVVITYLKAPSNDKGLDEILNYIKNLQDDNKIIIYDGKSYVTEAMIEEDDDELAHQRKQDQEYSETIFLEALKSNPMIQIYYCGSHEEEMKESDNAKLYPNVTYVKEGELVDDIMIKKYRTNQVTGLLILAFREQKEALQNFDLEETMILVSEKFNKQEIIDGLSRFCDYVESTALFKKCEDVSERVNEKLEPYVRAMIPKVEQMMDQTKPYVDDFLLYTKEFYENSKPKLNDAKEYIKSLF